MEGGATAKAPQKGTEGLGLFDPDSRLGQDDFFESRRGRGDPRMVGIRREDVGPYKSREAWRRAATHAVRTFIGRRVPHGELGGDVVISRNGIAHTLNNAADNLLLAATRLPDIIRTARRVGLPEPDKAGRPDIKAVHKLEGRVSLDGVVHATQIVVRETRNGKLFYDLALVERGRPQTGTESPQAQVRSQSAQAAAPGDIIKTEESGINSTIRFTEAVTADAKRIQRAMAASLREMGLKDVRVVIADEINEGQSDGFYWKKVIHVALDRGEGEAWATLNHEAIHAMRSLGLIPEPDSSPCARGVRMGSAVERISSFPKSKAPGNALFPGA